MTQKIDNEVADAAPEESEDNLPEEVESAGDATESVETEAGTPDPLEELAAKIQAAEEKYLRTVADFDNYRRRVIKEKEDLRQLTLQALIEDLLPAMDSLRLGLQAVERHPEAGVVAEGFRMMGQQIQGKLAEYGLEEILPEGEFDPHFQECMSHQPSEEVAEGYVLQVIRPGYKLKGRLIRPATVIVSSGAPESVDSSADPA